MVFHLTANQALFNEGIEVRVLCLPPQQKRHHGIRHVKVQADR
jgi:hypothetical protein